MRYILHFNTTKQKIFLRAFKAYLKFILCTTPEIFHCVSKIFTIIFRFKSISLERENTLENTSLVWFFFFATLGRCSEKIQGLNWTGVSCMKNKSSTGYTLSPAPFIKFLTAEICGIVNMWRPKSCHLLCAIR